MTKERQINSEKEPIDQLADRPIDELAVFIGGDYDVFQTLANEINNLQISEEEKNKKLDNIYKAANESGVDFLTLSDVEKREARSDE